MPKTILLFTPGLGVLGGAGFNQNYWKKQRVLPSLLQQWGSFGENAVWCLLPGSKATCEVAPLLKQRVGISDAN